jgi:hypothetical protein
MAKAFGLECYVELFKKRFGKEGLDNKMAA